MSDLVKLLRKHFPILFRLLAYLESLSGQWKLAIESDRSEPDLLNTLRYGAVLLSPPEAVQHFAAIGATGSGKTTILRLLLQDVLPFIEANPDQRLLINDPKQDVIPILAGMQCKVPVIISNPFDSRSSAWDMAKDVQEPRVALEIAFTLIPQVQESQPYFSDASRHFLYGVMLSYMWRNLDWQFSDVLRPLASPRLLRRVLMACPYTKGIVTRYFTDKKGLSNILSTVATKTLAFEPIASAWEASGRKFSIAEFVREKKILILGNSETSRHSIDAINRCIFKRASDLTLDLDESTSRRTWFFLDELSEAGKLDGLVSLCKKGRSKGACVVLAFQSIAGLRERSSYGPEITAEIMGQIGNRFIGKLECPETAEWAAKLVGDEEIRQLTVNHTVGKENSTSYNEQFLTRPTVLPSQFLSLPPCSFENGLTAWYLCRNERGVFTAHLPGHELFGMDLMPKSERVPAFLPRPSESQFLRPWTAEETAIFAPATPKKTSRNSIPNTNRFDGLDEL